VGWLEYCHSWYRHSWWIHWFLEHRLGVFYGYCLQSRAPILGQAVRRLVLGRVLLVGGIVPGVVDEASLTTGRRIHRCLDVVRLVLMKSLFLHVGSDICPVEHYGKFPRQTEMHHAQTANMKSTYPSGCCSSLSPRSQTGCAPSWTSLL
jgi:hypothetical protein